MTISDSTFLLDISIEQSKRLDLKKFRFKANFADLVDTFLLDWNELKNIHMKLTRSNKFKPETIRDNSKKERMWCCTSRRKEFGQTIILTNKSNQIAMNMKKYNLVLSLWCKTDPDLNIGTCTIPWAQFFCKYLENVNKQPNLPSVVHKDKYKVLNAQQNPIGSITIIIKLVCTSSNFYRYISSSKNIRIYGTLFSNPNVIFKIFHARKRQQNTRNMVKDENTTEENHNVHTLTKEDNEGNHNVNTLETLWQCESDKISNRTKYNALANPNPHFTHRVYCVNYLRVDTSCKSVSKGLSDTNVTSKLPIDLNKLLGHTVSCDDITCASRFSRKPPPVIHPTKFILHSKSHIESCICKKFEDQKGESAHEESDDPCYCSCECRYGFIKRTTYCKICGGYIIAGDDLANKTVLEMPIQCPISNKIDKTKSKPVSTSGSDSKSKASKVKVDESVSDKRQPVEPKKDKKEHKKNRRVECNYGYKAPQAGHTYCTSPCGGTTVNVPKFMGWFWTADNVPGLKYRPHWKPGAINKAVLRLLRNNMKNSENVSCKKKKKDTSKSKRPIKRPLLTVSKVDGEYNVTMETMKVYARPRAIHQQPYEDKPVLEYNIGRTAEENEQRQKKKDRQHRRLERAQRIFIQSAFRNMCKEICMKTYQQALGILPNAEDIVCPCYTAPHIDEATNENYSCSCSEDSVEMSETDEDEWLLEFTPPNALFDPTIKPIKSVRAEESTQYSYLDYRVKFADRFGKPVPRFFKGPDGKEQCSDLGGFYDPDNKWLEINVDGYVGPDDRWAPNTFIGPYGEHVDATTGKFQDKNLCWLFVGVDGYVDARGKWKFYSKNHVAGMEISKQHGPKKIIKQTKKVEKYQNLSDPSWSCFGEISPKQLSKLGISGHGRDKRFLMSRIDENQPVQSPLVSKKSIKKS